jgi:hypothetical protein
MASRSGLASAMPTDLAGVFTALYGEMWSRGIVDHPTKEVARLRNARITDCGY